MSLSVRFGVSQLDLGSVYLGEIPSLTMLGAPIQSGQISVRCGDSLDDPALEDFLFRLFVGSFRRSHPGGVCSRRVGKDRGLSKVSIAPSVEICPFHPLDLTRCIAFYDILSRPHAEARSHTEIPRLLFPRSLRRQRSARS